MTKKELSQLFHLDKEIKTLQEQKNNLLSIATTNSQNLNGMPFVAGVSDKVGNVATELAYIDELIKIKLQQYYLEYARLMAYIHNSIEDSLVRQIMTYRHINGLNWQQVACCVGGNNTAENVRQIYSRFFKEQQNG